MKKILIKYQMENKATYEIVEMIFLCLCKNMPMKNARISNIKTLMVVVLGEWGHG